MEEFKGKSNQELKEELNNLNEMQEFLKDEIDDEDMKKEYDDNQEKIDYLTKVVSDEPISVPEPSSEPQMDETILVAETEMGKPKDIKVPEIPKDLFFADGGMTKKYFVPRYVKDKISPNFLNVYIDYPTPSGVQVAYGKETMSGQQRRLGSEKAMNIAKEIVKDIKEKHRHNLEDIDYFDNERGKVTIFAVSDDFEDTNFALGGYLTSAGIGAYYGAKNPKSVKKVTDPIDKAISQIGKNLTDKKFSKGGKVGRYTSEDMPKFLENIFGKEYIDNVLIQKDQMDINFKDDGFFVGNRDIKAVEKKGWTFDSLSTYGTSGISLLFTRKSYAKGGALSKEFKFDKNFVIYVPSTTDVGNKISKKELDKRVGEVEKYVANEFGGYTETDTDGGYKSTSGEIIEEDIVKVSVFANNKDWKENESKVVSKVKEWATKWGQEAIGFEYEGDLYYIDEEGKFAKGGMTEKDKLDEAIKHFEDKIKKQGRITNARDEEQLSRLKELRKSFAEGGEVESSSELYDTYFEKYPYATELVAYYIYDYKDDNDIYNMEIGKYGKPIDITPYSELMLDYENTWKDKMPELDEQVKELIDNESMETGMFAKGGKLKGKKIINFYYDVYNNPNRYEDRDNSKLDGEYKKAFELAMANVKKDKKEGTYEFNKPYAKGGEIGDNVIVETDTKSLWRGKKLKGEIVSLSPFKIRTGPTSTSVIPDKLIKSVKSYAKGGEVITDSFGDKYELREDEEININDYVYFGDTGDISVVEDEEDLEFARAGKTKAIPYAKGGEIKVGDYVSVNAGYGMKHIGKVNSKHHMHNDRVYVDGIGDALEIKRLTKVKPPIMAKGGEIAHQEIIEWLEKHPELDGYNEDGTPTDETYQDAIEEIKAERGYAKGGETASPITNYHKNFMGTLSFDLKVKGMRKPQDFIVYPITGKTNIIRIQSDKKWGEIDATTGKGILSKTGNNSWAFALDVSNRNVNKFDLTPEELEELKSKIRETSGKEVGNVIITTDNSGAELLEEGGMLDMNEVEIYEGPDDNYTIVMKGDVYGMNTQTLPNLSINMYEGDRSEYPSDISHWGKKMKFEDAPIVIKEKIEMRKEEYKEGGRIMSEKDEDIEVMERLIADEKDEDIKIELQKELDKLKNK